MLKSGFSSQSDPVDELVSDFVDPEVDVVLLPFSGGPAFDSVAYRRNETSATVRWSSAEEVLL